MHYSKLPRQLFGLAFIALLVVGCRSSQARYYTRSTEIAAIVFATQTAEAPTPAPPTASPTLTPTPVPPTNTPTPAPVPPTNTPTPTPAPPTATPTPSPTPAAVQPSRWPLVLSDTFDANEHDWPTGSDPNEFVTNKWRITGGKYRWEVQAHQGVHWYVHPAGGYVSDFYLTVKVQQVSGPRDGGYGVVFRVLNSDNFYFFALRNTQDFIVWRSYRGKWTPLVDWTRSFAIRPGEVNQITVVAQGSHFVFWINDQLVVEADDEKLTTGRVGLSMELYEAGDEAIFEFDNFELRAP